MTATATTTVTTTPADQHADADDHGTAAASPGGTCAEPHTFGGLGPGETESATGINEGASFSWFQITLGSADSSLTFSLTGVSVLDSAGQAVPAGTDVLNVSTDCAGSLVAHGVTTFTVTAQEPTSSRCTRDRAARTAVTA